jgi:chloramphenicol 3-O phosphotransferase
VARALQEELLPVLYLNFSIDSILYSLPPSALSRMCKGEDISDIDYPALVDAYYQSARAQAAQGQRLILDDAVTDAATARSVQELFKPFDVLYVGLHCSLSELKRRELARGDRAIGGAEREFPRVHANFKYDLELDNSSGGPEQSAKKISDLLKGVKTTR